MRSADHIISVSPGYVDTLRCRYPALPASRFTVLPFPASGRDHDFMEQQKIVQTIFKKDGRKHWVYVGRGGPDMNYALGLLFAHLSKLKQQDPLLSSKLQLHFVGTSYAPTGRSKKTVEPLASSFGLDDIVHETSERIAYFEALAAYRDSDAVLLIGSESSDYTASKLFNCVLSGRPVFAIFHSNSLVTAVAANFPCVYITNFGSGEPDEAVVERLANQHLRMETEPFVACAAERLAPWLVEASTEAQCQIFDAVSSA